jgi:hypothetical protein
MWPCSPRPDNTEALDLFATLSEKGRGCLRDSGVAQRCRDKASQLRAIEREAGVLAKERAMDEAPPPPPPPPAPVRRCVVM